LRGLTATDARRIIRSVIYDDGLISSDDMDRVTRRATPAGSQWRAVLRIRLGGFYRRGRSGESQALDHRRSTFLEPIGKLDIPKGILLVGGQGGGKSRAAKAAAGMWRLPLLRLDFGTLYNKFFGETERNLREALKAAEAMAPCVLWIDEIEKAVAAGDYDNGTSRRILGNLFGCPNARRRCSSLPLPT
jgi:hypothetical protein